MTALAIMIVFAHILPFPVFGFVCY
jgi:hypothetical protein